MLGQVIYGMPRRCCNRRCRHVFYKESHLGWLPHSETEVVAVMRCPKCKDTFKVIQMMSMAHEYYEKLPNDPTRVEKYSNVPITLPEIDRVRRRMDRDPKILQKLFEGHVPGADNTNIKGDGA